MAIADVLSLRSRSAMAIPRVCAAGRVAMVIIFDVDADTGEELLCRRRVRVPGCSTWVG
jgi:hypothetical protein